MRGLFVALMLLFAVLGCEPAETPEEVAASFWKAVGEQDVETLRSLVTNPDVAQRFGDGGGATIDYEDFEVVGPSGEGAKVRMQAFCYPDAVVQTVIKEVDGERKVDMGATIKRVINTYADLERTREYCYSFEDQVLQGKLNGESWTAKSVKIKTGASGQEEWARIYPENCRKVDCFILETPWLDITNLNLEGKGGNFNPRENVTVTLPSRDSRVILDGSYRVSETDEGRKKLEISFEHDPDNHLNGYIVF